MSNSSAAAVENAPKTRKKKKSMFSVVMRRLFRNPLATIGLIILLLLILIAIFPDAIAPYSPLEMDYASILSKPSSAHIFGTDNMGRDIFSRCVYGARYSLSLGLIAALAGTVVGLIFGTLVGYIGGRVDNVVMRFCDIWGSIPGTLIVILLATAIGTGFFQTIFAMSIGGFPHQIRAVRAMCLRERTEEYLEAACSINCSKAKIIYRHMLPNIISPSIVSTTMGIGNQIMSAAQLSFIGLGIAPPTPEWGAMLSAGRTYLVSYPHLLLYPSLCIALTVLCLNMFGDGLRDALDPKLKD